LGAAQHDRITFTLQAVAGDEEARELLRRGRLERDLEPVGFGFADDLTIVSTPAPREPPPREPAPRRQAERPRRSTPAADEREQARAREEARREARRRAAAAERRRGRADRVSRDADGAAPDAAGPGRVG